MNEWMMQWMREKIGAALCLGFSDFYYCVTDWPIDRPNNRRIQPLLNARGRIKTRPSRPIRCDVWIVERMRYPTDRPTDQQTDTASYRGALSHLKSRITYSTFWNLEEKGFPFSILGIGWNWTISSLGFTNHRKMRCWVKVVSDVWAIKHDICWGVFPFQPPSPLSLFSIQACESPCRTR